MTAARHAKCQSSMQNICRGFTLIEILVVLVIAGLLAGVAIPRFYAMAQNFEIASQRSSLITEIGNLGYRAYTSGRAIELSSQAAPVAKNLVDGTAISFPPGWRMEVPQPIHYNFNGICSGGKITLLGPNEFREDLQLEPPLCKPAIGESKP